MRFIGFLFHEMAFGLLSIFLPLYVVNSLGGSLTDVGIMIAVANFVAVPFSFFWGYLSERTRQYRLFILVSFAGMSLLFYLFSLTQMIWLLAVLYVLIAIFHMAHEAPKNVLIAEDYSREDWGQGFASYEALTEVGWLAGLVLGFVLSGIGLESVWFILFVSLLNLMAFGASFFLIRDPLFIFERRLVAIERFFDFAHRGFAIASRMFDGVRVRESLKEESVMIFCAGLLLFSFATSMLFTPLPVFFSSGAVNLPQSLVFVVFMFNTFGALTGYTIAGRRAKVTDEKSVVQRVSLVRALLSLVLVSSVLWFSVLTLSLAVLVLVVMGLVYGLFLISTLSLSMELIPEGKAGVFNALVGLGGALGCFFGTFVAESFGFPVLFIAAGAVFFLSYIAFKTYTR